MHSIAKATIIVPLIIIILAVVLRLSGSSYLANSPIPSPITAISPAIQTPIPTKYMANSPKSIFLGKKLDLKGPLVCASHENESDMKLFIQNRKMYAKFSTKENTNYFLVNGNCGYKWVDGEKEGNKICNIEQYLSLFESLSSIPFFSPDMLFSFLPKLNAASNAKISNDIVTSVLNSCEKRPVDDILFEIPHTVRFVEQKMKGSPEDLLQ